MQSKLGFMPMAKFTALSLLYIFAWQSAFSPGEDGSYNPRLLYGLGIPKFDCGHGNDYYMGGDALAQSIIYFALFYMRLWTPGMAFMGFDLVYYGPRGLAGPSAGLLGALTLV